MIACWSKEALEAEVLRSYEAHVARLDGWIETLIERATELLKPKETILEIQAGATAVTKVARGLQLGARQLVATAMKLSRERLQAALLLARQDFWREKSAQNPCAPSATAATAKTAPTSDRSAVNTELTKGCDSTSTTTPQFVLRENTPVRARADESPDPLGALLARDAEDVFERLVGRRRS